MPPQHPAISPTVTMHGMNKNLDIFLAWDGCVKPPQSLHPIFLVICTNIYFGPLHLGHTVTTVPYPTSYMICVCPGCLPHPSRPEGVVFSRVSFSFNILFIYLFMPMSGLSCGTRDLHCSMRDLLLWCVGSVVVVCGLSCPTACGILVP